MKTAIIFGLFLFASPYFIGQFQYHNAVSVIQNLTEGTDSDIENTLSVFNFNIDCMTEPTVKDYYMSGAHSVREVFTF